jgi:hypothetical protein
VRRAGLLAEVLARDQNINIRINNDKREEQQDSSRDLNCPENSRITINDSPLHLLANGHGGVGWNVRMITRLQLVRRSRNMDPYIHFPIFRVAGVAWSI